MAYSECIVRVWGNDHRLVYGSHNCVCGRQGKHRPSATQSIKTKSVVTGSPRHKPHPWPGAGWWRIQDDGYKYLRQTSCEKCISMCKTKRYELTGKEEELEGKLGYQRRKVLEISIMSTASWTQSQPVKCLGLVLTEGLEEKARRSEAILTMSTPSMSSLTKRRTT